MKRFKSYDVWFFIVVLGFFFLFFTVHPIVPFDADDWTNLNFFRKAYPSLSNWNPTKIFPECFEPLTGLFAAYVVTPVIGDYLSALEYTNAFVVSAFIASLLYLTKCFLEYKFGFGKRTSILLTTLFALFHFLLLRTYSSENDYLWFSPNANCYYHYTIPNLLSGCLVLWLMRCNLVRITNYRTMSILLIALYLSLCSNLFATVILIAFIGANLVVDLLSIKVFNKQELLKYIKVNRWYLIIVLSWLVIQLMEANGLRAYYSNMSEPLIPSLLQTLQLFFSNRYNSTFVIFLFGCVCIAICLLVKRRCRKEFFVGRNQLVLVLSLFFSVAYQILLCSRVDPTYIKQGQVMYAFMFFVLLLALLIIAYLIANVYWIKIFSPFLVFFFFFEINSTEKVFKDIQYEYTNNVDACRIFNRSLISLAQRADEQGKDTLKCWVPDFGSWDNWPFTNNFEDFGPTLQKHGILNRKIHVSLERKDSVSLHRLSEPFFLEEIPQ